MIDYTIAALLEVYDDCIYNLSCKGCPWSDENGKCKLSGTPVEWDVRDCLEEEAGEDV